MSKSVAPQASAPFRALMHFTALPPGHITFRLDPDAFAPDGFEPHLKPGEYAVVDTSDREPQHGELYLIQWSNGPAIVQARCRPGHWADGSKEPAWVCGDIRGSRVVGRIQGGGYVLAGSVDGPYKVDHLRECLLGRVVGYAKTSL